MITNKQNLPGPIVKAIENDGYSAGNSDISVTSLIDSPRIVALKKQHSYEIIEDASDRIWSLLGQAVHSIIERAAEPGDMSETRLFAEAEGWKLSGQFDLLTEGRLIDFKTTSVWTVIDAIQNGKKVWDAQLNVLDWLCRKNNIEVEKLQIIAIIRDWSKNQARRSSDYPQNQVYTFDIPRWTPEQQDEYVSDRLRAHQSARNDLPLCTPEDRWEKPSKWAVMKKGRKSAIRLLDTETEAHEYGKRYVDGYTLEFRPGDAVRCSSYCAVADFCTQKDQL